VERRGQLRGAADVRGTAAAKAVPAAGEQPQFSTLGSREKYGVKMGRT